MKAKAASSSDRAKCRLVDRERERDGGGEDVQANSETSPNHSVATSHWSMRCVTLPRLANERQANGISSSQNQSQLFASHQGKQTRQYIQSTVNSLLLDNMAFNELQTTLKCVDYSMLFNMSCAYK